MKKFLGSLFAIWAIIAFVLTMLPVLLIIAITGIWKEPKRTIILHDIFAGWMNLWFVLVGVRRIFRGKENFAKGENYVIVCNHRSFMDVPLASPGIPGPNKTIAKIEMASTPLFGMVYKRGSVLVDRKSEKSRKESFAKMKQVLKMGLHMCIYPEGTRNKTAKPLQPFHDGAFRLAIDANKAVLPAVIFHTAKVLPLRAKFYFWPHKIEMHFLPPVPAAGKTVQELKEEVFRIMKEYYVQHNY